MVMNFKFFNSTLERWSTTRLDNVDNTGHAKQRWIELSLNTHAYREYLKITIYANEPNKTRQTRIIETVTSSNCDIPQRAEKYYCSEVTLQASIANIFRKYSIVIPPVGTFEKTFAVYANFSK